MCVHHWMIDSSNYGVCKKCKKTKDFNPGNNKLDRQFNYNDNPNFINVRIDEKDCLSFN